MALENKTDRELLVEIHTTTSSLADTVKDHAKRLRVLEIVVLGGSFATIIGIVKVFAR